nr:fimbrial protein [Bordetella genomosp. 6]
MLACEREHRGVSRVAVAAALAGNMALAACAMPDQPDISRAPAGLQAGPEPAATDTTPSEATAPRPAGRAYARAADDVARYGISVLAPASSRPVAPAPVLQERAIPEPCRMLPAETGADASVHAAAPAVGHEPAVPLPAADADVPASMPPGCEDLFPDVPPAEPNYAFGLETDDLTGNRSVYLMTGVAQPRRPWFSSVSAVPTVSYGDRSWVYRPVTGPSLAMGNLVSKAPGWGSTAPIGGVQLSDRLAPGGLLPEGQLGYSSVFGRLNNMDPAATSGAVDYGASAGSGMVRYGLTPSLTLEGQMQSAPSLTTRGVGTTYAAGELGTFQVGATQSTFDAVNAWRYRFGYNVNLADDAVTLGVATEEVGAGFGDLASFQDGGIAHRQMRNTLSAGVPISGWGTLSGTYQASGLGSDSVTERRFGLQHSMLLAPSVKFAVGADRDVISGDYEMRANISMPVDAFMRGRWLGF